ncbi:MAG: hypothetical protein R3264_11865, partial [Anaerolineae bacterium]|nr:hypothetical protein [Anaerolineae bacterium]
MKENQLTQRLFQSYKQFKHVLAEGEITFTEFDRGFNGDKCPEQNDLIPVLGSFQKIALNFSEFLEVLDKVLAHNETITAIQQMRPENKSIGVIDPRELLPFYWTINGINNRMHEKQTSISLAWEMTSALAIEYGYYGSSMTANTSLLSSMPTITGVFGEASEMRDIFTEFAPKFLKKEYIKGLNFMAERANFIATTPQEKLQSNEIFWWCNRVDMTPKDGGSLYTLSYLIEHCPKPSHPSVIERLQRLA